MSLEYLEILKKIPYLENPYSKEKNMTEPNAYFTQTQTQKPLTVKMKLEDVASDVIDYVINNYDVAVYESFLDNLYLRELYTLLSKRALVEMEENMLTNENYTSLIMDMHTRLRIGIILNGFDNKTIPTIITTLKEAVSSKNHSLTTTVAFLQQVDSETIPIDALEGWIGSMIIFNYLQVPYSVTGVQE